MFVVFNRTPDVVVVAAPADLRRGRGERTGGSRDIVPGGEHFPVVAAPERELRHITPRHDYPFSNSPARGRLHSNSSPSSGRVQPRNLRSLAPHGLPGSSCGRVHRDGWARVLGTASGSFSQHPAPATTTVSGGAGGRGYLAQLSGLRPLPAGPALRAGGNPAKDSTIRSARVIETRPNSWASNRTGSPSWTPVRLPRDSPGPSQPT